MTLEPAVHHLEEVGLVSKFGTSVEVVFLNRQTFLLLLGIFLGVDGNDYHRPMIQVGL